MTNFNCHKLGNPPPICLSKFLTLKPKEYDNMKNLGMPYYRGPPIMLTPAPVNYKS